MSRTFAYDAENRQKTATVNGVTETYTYDGEGRRVSKTNPSGTTVYVYDGQGELAVEYAPTAPASGTQYLIADALGTTRLVTGPTGAQVECHDYLPFGEEIGAIDSRPGCFGGDSVPEVKFTGKERDGRTGLDYFGRGISVGRREGSRVPISFLLINIRKIRSHGTCTVMSATTR
jgi:YD repeat-containing protein